jgi:hypothetical protein
MEHTIRTKDGGTVKVKNYARTKAIKLMCTECLGFGEDHPENCTSPKCPLFPYRGLCLAGYHAEGQVAA